MADSDMKPMTDADIETLPETTQFEAAAPLKDAGVSFQPEGGASGGSASDAQNGAGKAGQALIDGASRIGGQATDRLRAYAQDGQARAGSALDQLVQMLNDAAVQVEDKLGAQYGDYARQAAGTVSNFSETVKNKDVDELFDTARGFVRKSPGVAIGAAAAVGFVIARLAQSGIDAGKAVDTDRA